MLILRVMAQIFIAMAVMILGYDALNALRAGSIDPIQVGELVSLIAVQTGLATELNTEQMLALAEGWPGFVSSPYGAVLQIPAFAVFGVMGLFMALVFRARR